MGKLLLPFAMVFLLSTIALIVAGEKHINQNPDETICVQSRSCAINYINKLEKEQE